MYNNSRYNYLHCCRKDLYDNPGDNHRWSGIIEISRSSANSATTDNLKCKCPNGYYPGTYKKYGVYPNCRSFWTDASNSDMSKEYSS